MTTGWHSGASGERVFPVHPWIAVAVGILLVVTINATSQMMEMADRPGFAWWEPVLWEGSSGLVLAAMTPLVGWAVRRWPPRREALPKFVAIHLALTAPFCVIHVGAVAAMRSAVYAALHRPYAFFEHGIPLRLLYEWRKDALVYAGISLIYWWFDHEAARRTAASALAANNGRIEIRDGGGAVFLDPADLLFVEAAGNYVEFHTATRTYLARGTLAGWQTALASRGFIRTHRSHLINRARIAALKPTPAGDVQIVLDTGQALLGSRRYREVLGG